MSLSPRYIKNKIQDRIADINRSDVVKICETLKLNVLPKKKQNIKPTKGRKTINWAINKTYPFNLFILFTSIDPKFL